MPDNIERTYTPEELQKLVNAGVFRPQWYPIEVTCGLNVDDVIAGQVPLNNRAFVLTRITHQQITDGINAIPANDDLYTIDWSIYEQVRFYKGSIPMAASGYGSVRHGIWQDLECPVAIRGNETLHIRVQNRVQRVTTWVVQLMFKGVERVKKGDL